MTYLLVTCYDVRDVCPTPEGDPDDIYSYRVPVAWCEQRDNPQDEYVHMIRDPRAVLSSVHPSHGRFVRLGSWVDENRRIMQLKAKLFVVRFEDLIQDLPSVQRALATLTPTATQPLEGFHLRSLPPMKRVDDFVAEMGGVRAPDPSRIDAWRRDPVEKVRVEELLAQHEEAASLAAVLGYL